MHFKDKALLDDVINVAGHRLSTAAMEEVITQHKAVAECAVYGIEDDLKGQTPIALVVLKEAMHIDEQALEEELVQSIRNQIGAIASFKKAILVKRLPKTRSGKFFARRLEK